MAQTWIHRAVEEGTEIASRGKLKGRIVKPFSVFSFAEVLHRPRPEPLVRGVLEERSFSVIYGRPESGKSFVAFHLALCVATGRPWFGREVKQGPVLYIVGEGEGGLLDRADAWARHFSMDPTLVRANFMLQPINLLEKEESETLIGIAEDLDPPPVLTLFDTLARCMVGGDENSSKDMGTAIHHIGQLQAKIGCAATAIHHNAKGKELVERGSTALRGAADTMMHVAKEGIALTVSCQKQKNQPHFRPIHARLVEVDLGEIYSSCIVAHEPHALKQGHLRCLQLLGKAGDRGLTFTKLIDDRIEQGAGRTAAKAQLKTLCEEHLVETPEERQGGRYRITKAGLATLETATT